MPIVRKTICDDFQNHFKSENNNENIVSVQKNFGKFWSFLIVINAQENSVDHNSSHNKVFKSLRIPTKTLLPIGDPAILLFFVGESTLVKVAPLLKLTRIYGYKDSLSEKNC